MQLSTLHFLRHALLSQRQLRLISALLITFLCGTCFAASNSLYEVSVSASSEQQLSRSQAAKLAMRQLLERLTNDSNITPNSPAYSLIIQSEQYILQYQRVTKDPDDTEAANAYWFLFNEMAIGQYFTTHSIATVGSHRAALIVWLLISDQTERYLIDETNNLAISQQIRALFEKKGLPLIFPLNDLEDAQNVAPVDILGKFDDKVIDASERYDSDAILIADLQNFGGNEWAGNWRLHFDGLTKRVNTNKGDMEHQVDQGISQLLDELMRRLLQTSSNQTQAQFPLTIHGVGGLKQYRTIDHLLRQIDGIETVVPVAIEPRQLTLSIVTHLPRRLLNTRLQKTGRFIEVGEIVEPLPNTPESEQKTLHYRFK